MCHQYNYVVDKSVAQSTLEHRDNNTMSMYETLSVDLISAGGKSVDILVSTLTYRQGMASVESSTYNRPKEPWSF